MQRNIFFHLDGVDYLLRDKSLIRTVIYEIATEAKRAINLVNIVLCSKRKIVAINREFLGHDYPTDIITFEDSPSGPIRADLFICLDVVRGNAARYDTVMPEELHRVIFHGILHMCGYDDDTPDNLIAMRAAEERWLSRFASLRSAK